MQQQENNTNRIDTLSRAEGQSRDLLSFGRFLSSESGQVLPWVVVTLLVVLGVAGLVLDVGHAMVVQRQLQNSADAAALAAAENLGNGTYATAGQNYSAASGAKNAYSGVTVGTPTVTGLCLTTVAGWGDLCSASSPNAVQVTESASVPTFFARLLGKSSFNVSATSTASPGRPQPYNVAIVLDTTPSMADSDTNCGSGQTQLSCAETGAQQLLQGLAPSLDTVSLFTFPNQYVTSVSAEYGCSPGNNASVPPYTFPSATATSFSTMPYSTTTTTGFGKNQKTTTTTVQATYQVVGFTNDFRTSDIASTLNPNSNIVKAVGGKSGCSGMGTGYENTYYAGALYAAQSALLAQQAAQTAAGVKNSQNVIILLSDGNATAKEQNPGGAFSAGSNDMVSSSSQSTSWADSSGNYPNSTGNSGGSWIGECGQGITAAQYATNYPNDPTTVYTISYGSPASSSSANCGSDRSGGNYSDVTPCSAMQQMSSGWPNDKSHFYSDFYLAGSDTGCQAANANNTITSLNNIFKSILQNLTGARLIPNNTP